ncbi:MAG TPA: LptF/LptG family permease [Pirellulales bacterium]|jgi:lipopolysaccharide export system permease protein|nr:LptF/LptG family permease [Pirellulales bacterium]
MRILTRYVLFELIKVFLIALTGMTLFMVLVGVVREAYSQGLGLKQILLLIPYILPDSLRFAVPGTVLFATCSVYGRMASTNEVVAVKAQGISPWTILWPTFVFAFFLSLVAVWLNDVASGWGREGAKRVVIASVEEIVYSRLAQQRSYSSRMFSINVKAVDGRKLVEPTFTFAANDDSSPATINCEWAELKSDLVANTLTLVCYNGTIDAGGIRFFFPDKAIERVVPLDEASKRGGRLSPADVPLNRISKEIEIQQQQNEAYAARMALDAGGEMIAGDFGQLTGRSWADDQMHMTNEQSRLFRLLMEPSRRWANGFSCLFFVLIGAPMAIRMRNSDFLTSFFACFCPILVVYYPLLIFGVDQAKRGSLPGWSVWMGNVILAFSGAWLMRRVIRY